MALTLQLQTERERLMYLEGVMRVFPKALVTLDIHGQIVEWNPAAERLFGYSREETVGLNFDQLITDLDDHADAAGFRQLFMGGRELPPTEVVRYRKDGSPVNAIVAGSPLLIEDALVGAVVVYADITTRVQMEEALRALALVDELTGLYNRRGFFALAEQQLKVANRQKRSLVLLFCDFDGLKWVNDTFGHPEGDRALIAVAEVLKETFRGSDMLARIAGDEFVVLAIEPGVNAEVLIVRLQEKLESRNVSGDQRYKLALSVGYAHYDPEHPESIDDLLGRADRKMYEAKGGNPK